MLNSKNLAQDIADLIAKEIDYLDDDDMPRSWLALADTAWEPIRTASDAFGESVIMRTVDGRTFRVVVTQTG